MSSCQFYCLLLTWIICLEKSCYGCTFGSGSGCIFPCRCKDQAECDVTSGQCPDGCEAGSPRPDDDPDLFDWSGPGCQIGNSALNKIAQQIGTANGRHAGYAVDGELQGEGVCSQAITAAGGRAWWRVDLEDQNVVYNVTLFNTGGDGYIRMEQFVIGVGDSEDVTTHTQCADYGSPAVARGGSVTLTCVPPLTGRHVSYRRNGMGYEPHRATLCEVVVIGHRVVQADCSKCVSGMECENVLGCRQCRAGYKAVFCNENCDPGTYGKDCTLSCDGFRCSGGSDTCSPVDGTCPSTCDQWYTGDMCDQFIEEYSLGSGTTITVTVESSERVSVRWESEPNIVPSLAQYYFYIVEYREDGASDYQSSDDVAHVAGQSHHSTVISGLSPGTMYEFRAVLYRQQNGQVDRSQWPTNVVTATTQCTAPLGAADVDVTIMDKCNASLSVTWTVIGSSVCDDPSSVEVMYRTDGGEWRIQDVASTATSFVITNIQRERSYDVKVRITNKDNLSSDSTTTTVYVPCQGNSLVTVFGVLLGVSFVGNMILAGYMLRTRRAADSTDESKKPADDSQYVNVHELSNYEALTGDVNPVTPGIYDVMDTQDNVDELYSNTNI